MSRSFSVRTQETQGRAAANAAFAGNDATDRSRAVAQERHRLAGKRREDDLTPVATDQSVTRSTVISGSISCSAVSMPCLRVIIAKGHDPQ